MKLINFGLFQLGWFIAIWGAAHQTLLVSMIAISFILTIHIIQARNIKQQETYNALTNLKICLKC